ncbi:hypothetical protein [Empedobacter falsenii]
MKEKIFQLDDYKNYFKLNTIDHFADYNNNFPHNYFYFQISLPKSYFAQSINERILPKLNKDNSDSMIMVNLELFGKGSLSNKYNVFYFKPWILEEEQHIDTFMEQVLFIMPDYIFYLIIENELFKENLNWKDLKKLNVINKIKEQDFLKFGFNDFDSNTFTSHNLSNIIELDNQLKQEFHNFQPLIDNSYIQIMEEYY